MTPYKWFKSLKNTAYADNKSPKPTANTNKYIIGRGKRRTVQDQSILENIMITNSMINVKAKLIKEKIDLDSGNKYLGT